MTKTLISESEAASRRATGDYMRRLRRLAKLTQAEMADKLGYSANYYARVERGEHPAPARMLLLLRKV